jgi:hypothetical protein
MVHSPNGTFAKWYIRQITHKPYQTPSTFRDSVVFLNRSRDALNLLARFLSKSSRQMGCPALGIWVGFLKQPALPGKAPPKKYYSKKNRNNKNL